jgi:RimJ/RimL family protein N-acetyltransferase
MIMIKNIEEQHVQGFHATLDAVAGEKKYLAWTQAPPIESTRKFICGNIANNTPQVVALDDDRVIGWCDIEPHQKQTMKHVGTLGMGLLRTYRNKGIGTRLISAALERARDIGLEKVELEVISTNANAIALYQKMGFREEGQRRKAIKIDDSYHDCILMYLFLVTLT